MIADYCRIRI